MSQHTNDAEHIIPNIQGLCEHGLDNKTHTWSKRSCHAFNCWGAISNYCLQQFMSRTRVCSLALSSARLVWLDMCRTMSLAGHAIDMTGHLLDILDKGWTCTTCPLIIVQLARAAGMLLGLLTRQITVSTEDLALLDRMPPQYLQKKLTASCTRRSDPTQHQRMYC